MNHYNCRDTTGNLKLVLPGETRQDKFCATCTYRPHRGKTCLFPAISQAPTSPRKRLVFHANERYTHQDMINVIKHAWQQLGRRPMVKDLCHTHPTGSHISKRYPGGYPAACREAARQLEVEVQP